MATEEAHFDQGLEWVRPTPPLSETEAAFLEMLIGSTVDLSNSVREWPEMEGLIIGMLVDKFNRDTKALYESDEFPDFRFSCLQDIRNICPNGEYAYVVGSDNPDKKLLDEQLLNATLIVLYEFERFTDR